MTLPPRAITVLCLIQAFFVMAGFFITRSSLRLFDRVVPEMLGSHAPQIPALSQFVRSFGLWFLLVPVGWCVLAVVRAQTESGIADITLPQLIIGLALTLILAIIFSLSALYAVHISFAPV
jgi:hypothetical protein